MTCLIDTNILIDYYVCSQGINIQKINGEQSKYCASLRDFLIANKDLLISDLSEREFMLKLIDKFLETLTPPPNLGNKGFVEFADELVRNIINSLGINLVNTNGTILTDAYHLSHVINDKISKTFRSRKLRKMERRRLGRDIINIVHSFRSNAPLLTRDSGLINLLKEINLARCIKTELNELRIEQCNVGIDLGNKTVQATLILIV